MIISLILVAAVVGIVGFGVALSVRGKREFTKQNEVVPGMKSPAPASWAGAHSPEAKLHRRLGDAVRAAQGNPRLVELGLASQTQQIEAEAMAIDERLVAAAGLPASHRAEAVAEFEPQVAALEDAVAALVKSTTVADSKELLQQSVSEADIKLRALAEARAEIEAVDRTASGTLPAPGPARSAPTNAPTDDPAPDPAPETATAPSATDTGAGAPNTGDVPRPEQGGATG